ncbi:hypothetical protein [Nonomuraea sp. NPDC002799]
MSSPRKTDDDTAAEAPAERSEADRQAEHADNAQWLKDNPDAMPQVDGGRWAVYDRDGHLCGHLVGDGPTRDTRFKAIAESGTGTPPDDGAGGYGITLHDAGAHLLDATLHDDPNPHTT